jgi:hypothetical protein
MNKVFGSIKRISILILVVTALHSCDVIQQAQKMANFSKCEFRLQSVNELTLAGVNVQKIHTFSDLSLLDAGKLTTAVASNSFPLDFILNVEAKNPNTAVAGLSQMEWILFIDDLEMTSGVLNKAVTIPANNGIAVIPMKMHMDLKDVLSGKSANAMINFGLNLAGIGSSPTRFKLKLKPTVNVGSLALTYPGYITVGTEFTGNSD